MASQKLNTHSLFRRKPRVRLCSWHVLGHGQREHALASLGRPIDAY